jgi:hypothetical protein
MYNGQNFKLGDSMNRFLVRLLPLLFFGLFTWNDSDAMHYAFKKLTVLTGPVPARGRYWEHHGVMRSLRAGMDKIKAPYNYNPTSLDDIGDVILVVSNSAAIRQAIELKNKGRIKKLLVGPNFSPWDVNYPEIDVYIVPSDTVIPYTRDLAPAMAQRCHVWYVGVDQTFWIQSSDNYLRSKDVLIYWKTEGEDFCKQVEDTARSYGWNPKRLRFGSYNHSQYKELLSTCRFAIFISRNESQGIALAEAWAMNIPTLVWEPKEARIRGEKIVNYLSAAPYLTENTGIFWKYLPDLENILQTIETVLPTFCPRSWVMEHMTDEISAYLLVDLVNKTVLSK